MVRYSLRRRPSGPPQPSPLDNGVAIVTGAASGIGKETALALHRRGCTVAVLDVNLDGAAEVVAEIEREGGRARAWLGDVRDRDQLRQVAAEVDEDLGPATVVVNNAGVGITSYFQDATLEDWDWIRSINLDGVINGCEIFGRPMLEREFGHVVNIASGLGYLTHATEIHYCTTKAAVLMFSKCLRSDWIRRGVGVSVICPGIINTPIIEATRRYGVQDDDEKRDNVDKLFARGHHPAKVADAIIDAIDDNDDVVPVGWEAKMIRAGTRLLPDSAQIRLARADARLP
jgi:NAD(P)-dependent dehydrogenase (short-subunit alcohol dehydrogenase family)